MSESGVRVGLFVKCIRLKFGPADSSERSEASLSQPRTRREEDERMSVGIR